MKKHNLEIFLKKSRVIWKKNILKNTIIKLNILAGLALKKPPLSTNLTILGVNVDNFINNFNAKTSQIFGTDELLLPTTILISPSKSIEFSWKLPTIFSLYKKIFPNNYWEIFYTEDDIKMIISRFTYKVAIAKTDSNEIYNQEIIQGKMSAMYASLISWDKYKFADHEKDKKRHKKKK